MFPHAEREVYTIRGELTHYPSFRRANAGFVQTSEQAGRVLNAKITLDAQSESV